MLNQAWCVDCVGWSINSSVPLRAQSYSFRNVVIKRLCLIIKYWNATCEDVVSFVINTSKLNYSKGPHSQVPRMYEYESRHFPI